MDRSTSTERPRKTMARGPRTRSRWVWTWRSGAVLAAMATSAGTAGAQVVTPVEPPLSLGEAVERAMGQSREVQDARLALEVAEEQVQEAWSSVYPSVDFSASYTRNVSPNVSFLPARIFDPQAPEGEFISVQFGADNTWQTAINLEQPLFQAQAFLGVGAAGRFRALQEETLRGRTQTVVTRVRTTYYDLLLAQEELRLTENSVRRIRESLEETRALNKAGLTADYDVLRLEVELANVEPNLRRAANAVALARRQLAVELDVEDAESLRVTGSLATMDLSDPAENSSENREILAFAGMRAAGSDDLVPDVGRAIERAREMRSDLRQLELTESLRQTEVRVEQVQYLPEVSLFGTYSIQAQQNGDPDFFGENSSQRGYGRQVGVQVTLPLFSGFSRDARIDQKRAALRQAETQTRLARDQAENQVRTLVDQAEEARLRAEAQRLAVQQAERGFEIASAQYREGIGSQLERTDAEVALRESEFNYAQAVYDFLRARAELDQAIGQVPLVPMQGVPTDGPQ